MKDLRVVEIRNKEFASIEKLAEEAAAEGHSLGRRFIDEWKAGVNTFSKPGEKLWAVYSDSVCVAFGGLNVDPYANDVSIGRVRHIYVAKEFRGRGISRLLMNSIIAEAKKHFTTLWLSTKNPVAISLYESLGFAEYDQGRVTHRLDLTRT